MDVRDRACPVPGMAPATTVMACRARAAVLTGRRAWAQWRRAQDGARRVADAVGSELTERALPPGPAELFAAAHPVLADLLGEERFRLGGGTALAAVWAHRHSTDVDLFADHATYVALYESAARKAALEQGLREALRPDVLDILPGDIHLLCPAGELSVITTPAPLTPPPAVDRVAGTRVELERPATILARKLRGRMMTNGVVVLRDLYDIAAARELAPEDLTVALACLSAAEREDIAGELQGLSTDWAATPRKSGRPLIKALRPAALAAEPARAIAAVRHLLSDEGGCRIRRGPTPRDPEP